MKQLHYVYLKYVMGKLEHDAIMVQARRCGVDSVKKCLDMIVTLEVEHLRKEFIEGLSEEELRELKSEYDEKDGLDDIDPEIPF